MTEKRDKIRTLLPPFCAVLLVTAMTAAAELSGEKEILFPEIAAIAAGAFAAPKFAWNVSFPRMLLMLSAGAVLGTLTVLLPAPYAVQVCLAFLAASVMLLVSRTTFAPMISAVVLPVMLQTKSPVYPVSAVILSAAVIAVRLLLQACGVLQKPEYHPEPKPSQRAAADLIVRWLLGSLVIVFAILTKHNLICAPPLLVAFTEFWKPGSAGQKKPFAVSIMIAFCAVLGAGMRELALFFGVYQFPAAGIAMTLVLLLMRRTGLYIPPAAALAVLAFLIPERAVLLYPVLVFAGALFMTGIASLHGKFVLLSAQSDEKNP